MTRRTPHLLPQVSFSIMLALSLKPRHGYELMQQVEQDSNGIMKIGPGALYSAIKQLREDGLIEEITVKNGRRRHYQLTAKGLKRLGAELEYFKHALILAGQRKPFGNVSEAPIWVG